MDEPNPYAPPSPIDTEPKRRRRSGWGRGAGVWQENGRVVVAKDGGELPERCVVCNKHTRHRLSRTFTWHPPAYYLLICAGWIVYLIVMLIVRKSATVEIGLCDEHRLRRRNGLLLTWGGLGGGFLLVLFGATSKSSGLVLVALGLMAIGSIAGSVMARTVTPKKIDDTHLWLDAGAPFVTSLPDSPDEPPPPKDKRSSEESSSAE